MATYIKGTAYQKDGKFGPFILLNLNIDDLMQYKNDKGWVNLIVSERKSKGKYGETHSIVLNEYKREKQEEAKNEIPEEDIPF